MRGKLSPWRLSTGSLQPSTRSGTNGGSRAAFSPATPGEHDDRVDGQAPRHLLRGARARGKRRAGERLEGDPRSSLRAHRDHELARTLEAVGAPLEVAERARDFVTRGVAAGLVEGRQHLMERAERLLLEAQALVRG